MTYLYTALKKVGFSLMLIIILLISLLSFLLTTKAGLYLSVKLASAFLPGTLSVDGLDGRLIDTIHFKHLNFENDKVKAELEDFDLNWRLKALLHPKVTIKDLKAKTLRLTLKPNSSVEDTPKKEFKLNLPFQIQIDKLVIDKVELKEGISAYTFENLNLSLAFTQELLTLSNLNFIFNNLNFGLQGNLSPIYPYTLAANLAVSLNNQPALPLKAELKLKGDYNLYYWEGSVSPLNVNIRGTLNKLQDINNLLEWNNLIWPLDKGQKVESSKGSLSIKGRIPDLKIKLQTTAKTPMITDLLIEAQTSQKGVKSTGLIHLNNDEVHMNLVVDNEASPKIKASLYSKNFKGFPAKIPLQQIDITTNLTANNAKDALLISEAHGQYLNEPLKAKLRYQQNKILGTIDLGANKLTIEGSPPYPLKIKATLPKPELLHESLAGLKTLIVLNANLEKANKGELNLKIAPGSFQLPNESELKTLSFEGGNLKAVLNTKELNLKSLLTIDKQKTFNLALRLPQFSLDKPLTSKQKIEGNLKLLVNSLSFLETISPLVSKADGQLQTELKINGTIEKPILNGNISLNKGILLLPSLGLNLNPIQLSLLSTDKNWQAKASIAHEGKIIHLTGDGNLTPQVSGKINIVGNDFPLIKTDEYLVYISPNLALNFDKKNIQLTGNILVPEAQLKPQTFNSSVNLSDDAIFINHEEKAPENPLHMKTDISIAMGEKVQLDVKGLHGLLSGGIRIQQAAQGPLNASGELKVNEGKYQAYGQDLEIEQGELIFTGGLISNPGIHVKAVRNISNTTNSLTNADSLFNFNASNIQTLDLGENTTVGIEVTGRLKSPKVHLFSSSAGLSQADILSLLILGKPASQANQAGGQLLLNAISALKLDSGAGGMQLVDQLKQSLGVDINIKSKTSYNQQTNQFSETNAVVVSKTLSKRLFLSYNYGLTQSDVNVLTLTYLLNKFFSIQVNASTNASGIDLLYSKRKE